MQFKLLKTKKHEVKVAIAWTKPGFYLLGFCFLQEHNSYDTRIFYFSIDLIFWKIAFNINKNDPLDQII